MGCSAMYNSAGARIVARQQLQPVYHRNGVAYAMTRACLVEQRTIMGARAGAFVLGEPAYIHRYGMGHFSGRANVVPPRSSKSLLKLRPSNKEGLK